MARRSGTKTLTFTSTISTINVSVPAALAITQVNLPAGSIIVDAAGDTADLSDIIQPLAGASAVTAAALQGVSSAQLTATSSAMVTPAGSSSPSDAVLGVSSNSLAFIAPPGGGSGAAGSGTPDWLNVSTGNGAAAFPTRGAC